jgi:hypothetical protein
MTHNYTFENFDNINSNIFISSLTLEDYIIELIDIIKVNIILLAPITIALLLGYIIGKIHLNSIQRYEDLNKRIMDVNNELSKYDNIIDEIDKMDNDINQQIIYIFNELQSIKSHINTMNELLCSEINNNNIFNKNIHEKIDLINKQLKELFNRVASIEIKENYVLIGYRKHTDIPVFVSTEITKISNEEIKKYHLQETCIILPLLASLPKLKEIHMPQLQGLWLSFDKIILKKPSTDTLMYAGEPLGPGSHYTHPKDSVYKHNIPKIESFCNTIGVKLIFNIEQNNANIY